MSDYVNSIQRLNSLRIKEIYPGHGKVSNTPDEDLPEAVAHAQTLLNDTKMFFEALIKTKALQEKMGVNWLLAGGSRITKLDANDHLPKSLQPPLLAS